MKSRLFLKNERDKIKANVVLFLITIVIMIATIYFYKKTYSYNALPSTIVLLSLTIICFFLHIGLLWLGLSRKKK